LICRSPSTGTARPDPGNETLVNAYRELRRLRIRRLLTIKDITIAGRPATVTAKGHP